MATNPGIYVEVRIRGSMESLWSRTQDSALHRRWDLRFSEIRYLPRPDDSEPQRFLYATTIGLGIRVEGEGESVGLHDGPGGERTSSLKFRSDDPRALILEGSGYWKYIPNEDGIRFLTWYDYRTRFGAIGRAVDAALFRPLMGWATAWSFDRLRLWIERGIEPEASLQRSLAHATARVAIALVFLYHGLVPKLIARHPDELEMLRDAGLSEGSLTTALRLLGVVEVVWGLVVLSTWRSRWPFAMTAALMVVATIGVAVGSPRYLVAAFNPGSLNLSVFALGAIGWLTGRDRPSSSHCLRRRPGAER